MSAGGETGREAALQEVIDRLRTPPKEKEPNCALCRLARQSVERGVRLLFAEFVNDPKVRESWRRSGGFCSEHTVLAASLGDALGIAILYIDLARLARERLASPPSRRLGSWITDFGSKLKPAGASAPRLPCPACALEYEAEARYAAALAAGLEHSDGEARTILETGAELCLPHLELTLAAAPPEVADRLRRRELERLAALEAELEEIVRKNDYRFRGEPWGAERDAWLRALSKLRPPRN